MPVEPRLLNATDIIFSQKSEATQQYDHLRRTTVNLVAREAQFTIQGQVKWNMTISLPVQNQEGVDDEERGYIILRTKDLTALNKTIKRGDLIKKMGQQVVNLYVLRIEFGSHYGGEFKLAKVVFTDRDGKDG